MVTGGKERSYRVTVDEGWPRLVVSDDGPGADAVVPERLVNRLRDAQAGLKEAEEDIARWVKYSTNDEAKAGLRPLIDELPTPEETKARRKRR